MTSKWPRNFASSESLEESLLPQTETEAEILFCQAGRPDKVGQPVRLGGADLGGNIGEGGQVDIEEQGMLMGPSHPIFSSTRPPASAAPSNPLRPELSVPPGARFDPITPVGPGFYSPGDPDFDDLLPPGGPADPLAHSVRPPLKSKSGSKPFQPPPSFGGHPHGAPPGPGNPPFFM